MSWCCLLRKYPVLHFGLAVVVELWENGSGAERRGVGPCTRTKAWGLARTPSQRRMAWSTFEFGSSTLDRGSNIHLYVGIKEKLICPASLCSFASPVQQSSPSRLPFSLLPTPLAFEVAVFGR
jgi:hypothetical protein